MEYGRVTELGDHKIVERRYDACSPWTYDVSFFHEGIGWQFITSFETAKKAFQFVRDSEKHRPRFK